MNISFDNKTVLITGSSRGIGSQLASDFESLGANVIGFSLSPYTVKDNFVITGLKPFWCRITFLPLGPIVDATLSANTLIPARIFCWREEPESYFLDMETSLVVLLI